MPFSINIDDALGRRAQQRREADAANLAQSLLERGAEPDAVNEIAATYAATGEFKVPEYQTKHLPGNSMFPDGIPIREPFAMPKQKKALYGFDAQQGIYTDASGQPVQGIPDDVDPQIRNYKEPGAMTGRAWRIDKATDKREDMGPNGKTSDTYIDWNSKTGAGGGGGATETPQQKLARQIMAEADRAEKDGKLTEDLARKRDSAAEFLGLELEEVEGVPTFGDKVRNVAAMVTHGTIPAAKPRPGYKVPVFGDKNSETPTPPVDEYARDLKRAQEAVAKKLITKEEAQARLQKKYGNRAK